MKITKNLILLFFFTQAMGLLLIQIYFYNLQTIGSEKTKTIISSLLKYERINHNPYTLAESLQTLEKSGLVKCTTLSLGKDGYIYFNTYTSDICSTTFISLKGKILSLSMKSVSGVVWNIKTISLNSDAFYSSLILSRFSVFTLILFIFFVFMLYDKNKGLQIELLHKESLIYQQVSHDVRSPLYVLNALLHNENNDELNLDLVKSALGRLDSILQETNLRKNERIKKNEEFEIVNSLKDVITEKNLIFKGKFEIKVNVNEEGLVYVIANKSQLQRVISNLLNNAIEASKKSTKIEISLNVQEETVLVRIRDYGDGFPENIISKLGKVRVSEGKENSDESGSGIGLLHAVQYINSIGGRINFTNKAPGAEVEILLKLSRILKESKKYYEYLYIEDDELMCFLWSEKAKKNGKDLKILNHPMYFNEVKDQIDLETKIYCDSEFSDAKGEDFLLELYSLGYRNLFLTTGHSCSKFNPMGKYKVIGKSIPF